MNLLRIKSAIWNFNGQFVTDLIVLLGLAVQALHSIHNFHEYLCDQKVGQKMPETVGKLVKYGNRCEFGNYSHVNVLHLTRCIDANIDKPFRYYLQH